MRVLMLSWEYPPHVVGGLGKHVMDIIPALGRQDVEVHLVTPRFRGGETRERSGSTVVHRITLPEACCGSYAAIESANQVLRQACDEIIRDAGPFDLLHNHDWLTSFAARELKSRHKLPMVATIHATERGRGHGHLASEAAQLINDAEWWLTYDAWRVICCANYMADQVSDYFGKPADSIDVIPNGVDPSPFRALEGLDLTEFRSGHALSEEKIVFHVGRMVNEKGVEILIRSVPQVLVQVPQARFVIAGKGPELEHLRGVVQQLGLAHKVDMLGFVSDADRDRLYKVADCAVFPSLYEPFGIVALEAMAAGTPVVVSKVGGLCEVVQHAETGITVYPNNVDSCAWGIIQTLQHPDWARQRARNAMRQIETIYSWDTIAKQTRAVYERVIEHRRQVIW